MAVRAKRSEVWKYFTEIRDHKVESNKICQAKLIYQRTSKTMRQHMFLKHNREFGKADPPKCAIFITARRSCNRGRGEKITTLITSGDAVA